MDSFLSLSLCFLIATHNDLCMGVLKPISVLVRILLGVKYEFVPRDQVRCWPVWSLSGVWDPDISREESLVADLQGPNHYSFEMCQRTLLVSNEPKKG